MYRFILSNIIWVLSGTIVFGQDNFAEAFINVPRNNHIYIPSNACILNDAQADVIYKTYAGKLSIIKTFYADLNFSLKNSKNNLGSSYKHVIGAALYNDKEGDFFSKIRVLGRYGIHIPVKQNLVFAAGMAFHIINYSLQASGSGASGSAFSWSGNLGLSLYSPSFKAAVSLNDINNPEVRPIDYMFSIPRYLILYSEKSISINENTQIMGSVKGIIKHRYPNSYFLHAEIIFSRLLSAGSFLYINRGWGLAVALNNIKLLNSNLDFSATYYIPDNNTSINVVQYELNLRYNFKKAAVKEP